MRFLVGGYTADMEGTAEGIGLLAAGDADSTTGGVLSWRGTLASAPYTSPSLVTSERSLMGSPSKPSSRRSWAMRCSGTSSTSRMPLSIA